MRRNVLGIAFIAGVFLAATAAHAVRLDIDADSISNATWDDASETGTTGDGGGFLEMSFELDGATFDLDTLTVELSFLSIDHNFIIHINGTEVVPIDPSDPAEFTPGLVQTWLPNGNGLPRLVMSFSASGIEFSGTETTSSTALSRPGSSMHNRC